MKIVPMRLTDGQQYCTLDSKLHAALLKDMAVLPVLLYKAIQEVCKLSTKEKIAVFHLHVPSSLRLLLSHLNICTTSETRSCVKTAQHFEAPVLKSKQQTELKH